ncbi:MAG: hypothetical protein LBK95_16095 [Bifidobacteriaceae bacterium]|jgi:hypothetical protein|nr:hypothetical protein [Bifidobacteriaceae bacterium]
MTDTVPIRVPVETRDQLKRVAAGRGTTIPKALAQLVSEAMWQEAFRAEREAQILDSQNPAVQAEDAEWDAISDEAID